MIIRTLSVMRKEFLHIVRTHVHDMAVVTRANPEKFVRKYVKKEAYTTYDHYLSPFFLSVFCSAMGGGCRREGPTG